MLKESSDILFVCIQTAVGTGTNRANTNGIYVPSMQDANGNNVNGAVTASPPPPTATPPPTPPATGGRGIGGPGQGRQVR